MATFSTRTLYYNNDHKMAINIVAFALSQQFVRLSMYENTKFMYAFRSFKMRPFGWDFEPLWFMPVGPILKRI